MITVKEIILKCVKSVGKDQKNKDLISPQLKTKLFGDNLDSAGIVFLITEVEEAISKNLNFDIVLADERAMSQKTSPFRNVETLIAYTEKLISKKKN
tara:strand:+ start:208 stop:498 length:291 start_codon:yes stop_codon:yes gene_type:complete